MNSKIIVRQLEDALKSLDDQAEGVEFGKALAERCMQEGSAQGAVGALDGAVKIAEHHSALVRIAINRAIMALRDGRGSGNA